MKTKMILKLTLSVVVLVFAGLVSHDLFGKTHSSKDFKLVSHQQTENIRESNFQQADVIITIDKNTKDSEFEDIKDMLAENGIKGSFKNVERNEQGEITGIKIEMIADNGQSSNIQLSSNLPIDKISFGRKNGQIFVEQNGANLGNFALLNNPSFYSFGSPNDSIFKQQFSNMNGFNFDDFFNDTDKFMFQFGDSTSLGDLMKQMHSRFNSMNQGGFGGAYSLENDPQAKSYYIIVDGKESTYSNLKKLEENGNISSLEVLSPERAKMFYGEKAEKGALIVSTK